MTALLHVHVHQSINLHGFHGQSRQRFYLTPSLSVHAVVCGVVRKIDSFHEEIRQTFGAVAAGVKR